MPNRLVRKLDLEIALSKIAPHPSPKAYWEQYTITPKAAAELLYIAAYTHNDLLDKTIADLGCGTGRLAIGSTLLGAREAVGVDIDRIATQTALKNAEKLGAKERLQWITTDVTTVRGNFDTVLQNPPFGVQKRKADRKFLEKALEIGTRIYSLHKSSDKSREFLRKTEGHHSQLIPGPPSVFLKNFIETRGGRINAVYTMPMKIPHMFTFHTKPEHEFLIDLYIIDKPPAS